MLKRILNFIKGIFIKKRQALPEFTTCYRPELVSATLAAENNSQFLKHNDELVFTIKNDEEYGSNVNIEVLRDGKILEIDDKLDNEISEVSDIEIQEKKEKPIVLETEELDVDEKITNPINCEYSTEEHIEEKEEIIEKSKNVEDIEMCEDTEENEMVEEDTSNTENIISYLKAFEFDDYEIDEIIMNNTNILYTDSEIVLDNLNALTNIGIKNKDIYNMVKKQPLILIDEAVRKIKEKTDIFKKKGIDVYEIYELYINNPDLLLLETKQIEQSCKVIKKFYKSKDRLQYIMKYFPKAIGMTDLVDIRKCVEKM